MQILGHKEGLSVMEQADPLVLLVGCNNYIYNYYNNCNYGFFKWFY